MLRAVGLEAMTNDQVITPSLLRLGLDEGSDEFIFAMRTAVPASPDEFNSYMEALGDKVRIFRVRPKSVSEDNQVEPVLTADPLPVPPLRVAGTGSSELDLNPTRQLLRQHIIDKYPGYTATDIRIDHWFEEPYPGLQRDMVTDLPGQDGVLGATSDALYLGSATSPCRTAHSWSPTAPITAPPAGPPTPVSPSTPTRRWAPVC